MKFVNKFGLCIVLAAIILEASAEVSHHDKRVWLSEHLPHQEVNYPNSVHAGAVTYVSGVFSSDTTSSFKSYS